MSLTFSLKLIHQMHRKNVIIQGIGYFFSIFNIFQSVFLPSLIIGIIINVENVALHALFIYALELGIR